MTDSKILKKIQKLLALSNCKTGNVNEVAAAAAQAAKLMAEHNLSRFEVESAEDLLNSDPIKVGHIKDCQRSAEWRYVLLGLLCEANDCVAMKSFGTLGAIGQESSVEAVRYFFGLFEKTINRLCKDWVDSSWRGWGTTDRNSFRLGAAETIGSRMIDAKQRTRATASQCALVKIETVKERVKECLNGAKIRTFESSDQMDGARYQGRRAGHSVELPDTTPKEPARLDR
jgi:hypothetical protein